MNKFDQDFYSTIEDIYKYSQALKSPGEVQTVAEWVERLSNDVVSNRIRCQYASLLLSQLRRGVLCEPFASPPDWEQPLVVLDMENGQAGYGDSQSDSSENIDPKYPLADADCPCSGKGDSKPDERNPEVQAGENMDSIYKMIKYLKDRRELTLPRFVSAISEYTYDKGEALQMILHEEMSVYRKIVEEIFQNRLKIFENEMLRKQSNMKAQYDDAFNKQVRRLHLLQEKLKLLEPNFDWDEYRNNHDEYIKKIMGHSDESHYDERDESKVWRKQMFHNIEWLKRDTRRLQLANENAIQKLTDLRQMARQMYEKQAQQEKEMNEQNAGLAKKANDLRSLHNKLGKKLANLFIELERKENKYVEASYQDRNE